MIDNEFANKGLVTLSVAVNLYRFIEMYTEVAVQKDLKQVAQLYYWFGVRLNS